MRNIKNGFQKIVNIILTVLIASAAIASGAFAYRLWVAPTLDDSILSNKEQVIGGDKDEHGCLIAAGYSWCDNKQKCIRPWEEACDEAADAQAIGQAFAQKYSKAISDVTVKIGSDTGNYAKGSVTFGQGGPGEGGYFFAYKDNGVWKIAADGNGSVSCRYLEYYGFPASMTENFCYESGATNDFSETGNLVKRNIDGRDAWVLVYEKPGQPALEANLTFIQESFCDLGQGLAPCSDNLQFEQGQRAQVTGQKVSVQGVTVYNLKIIK